MVVAGATVQLFGQAPVSPVKRCLTEQLNGNGHPRLEHEARHADTRCGPTLRDALHMVLRAAGSAPQPGAVEATGNPVRDRDCPAAVSGNDRRQTALGRRSWEATASRGRDRSACPRVRRPASAPRPSGAVVRGLVGRPTAGDAQLDRRRAVRLLLATPDLRTDLARRETVTVTDSSPTAHAPMQVRKRNGDSEPVDVNKIVRAVDRVGGDLADVDPMRVATRTISGLYDGATTAELDRLSIQTAAEMIGEEPQYSRLAARLLAGYIDKEVRNQGVASFSQSVALGHAEGLIGDETARVRQGQRPQARLRDRRRRRPPVRVLRPAHGLRPLPAAAPVDPAGDRDPAVLPAAGGLRAGADPGEAIGFYRLMSSLAYLPSSPTLFNSGTRHTQMSSCYLVDSPRDDLDSIYSRYAQVAKLSKFAGGIGIAFSRVRSRGALIRGTNGQSNGIVPFLRTLDSSVAAVNQGGRRKGAACVYLEPWHPDVEEFLELRDNTGEDARRTHNLNLANWIPDEFMRRVEADEDWSLIDPDQAPELPDLWGEAFDAAYRRAEEEGRYVRQVKARDLYGKMMRTLAQTGNGWMTFKDAANRTCNQTRDTPGGPVVHLSNLCTEIIEVSSRRRDRGLQPRARSTSPSTSARRRRRSTGTSCARRCARRCRCSTGSSTSTTTRARRRRRPTRAGARSGSG